MITTKLNLTPYLAEYIRGKFGSGSNEPVRIPDSSDLYHTIWELMAKRPDNVSPVDHGNLSLQLPERRIGKDPMYHNYLSERSQKIIDIKIRRLFYAELHQLLDENQQEGRPLDNISVIYRFMCSYSLESISEDALLKNYYRWRINVRKKIKRKYKRA